MQLMLNIKTAIENYQKVYIIKAIFDKQFVIFFHAHGCQPPIQSTTGFSNIFFLVSFA